MKIAQREEGTRRFGGKKFEFYGVAKTRRDAQSNAKQLRKIGYFVRIVPMTPLFYLWTRKMKYDREY